MDKKFLNKVTEQIISETRIDYNELSPALYTPFFFPPLFYYSTHYIHSSSFIFLSVTKHCKDIYGLNEQEIEYVWDRYRDIIKNKIENE